MTEILERNKNLNRGFRKLNVWRGAIDLYEQGVRLSLLWLFAIPLTPVRMLERMRILG